MCALSVCAFADGRLYDDAGLLSDDEAAQVSALLDEVSDAHSANTVSFFIINFLLKIYFRIRIKQLPETAVILYIILHLF